MRKKRKLATRHWVEFPEGNRLTGRKLKYIRALCKRPIYKCSTVRFCSTPDWRRTTAAFPLVDEQRHLVAVKRDKVTCKCCVAQMVGKILTEDGPYGQ